MALGKTHDRVNYHDYIYSDRWRKKHKIWLKRCDRRCSMFPWIRLSTVKGKYHKYEMHHTHYGRLGRERYWWDVLPLSPIAHDWVIHGILAGFKSAGKQKHYPNGMQRIAHAWCRVPHLLKAGVVVGAIALACVSLAL